MKTAKIKYRSSVSILSERLDFGIYTLSLRYMTTFSEPLVLGVRCKDHGEVLYAVRLSDIKDKSEVRFSARVGIPYSSANCEVFVENPRERSKGSAVCDFTYAEVSIQRAQLVTKRQDLIREDLQYNPESKAFEINIPEPLGSCYVSMQIDSTHASRVYLDILNTQGSDPDGFSMYSDSNIWSRGLPVNLDRSANLRIRQEPIPRSPKSVKLCIYKLDTWAIDTHSQNQADIGVIVPMFDTYDIVRQAVKSLLNQTVRPRVIYLVDDCSPNVDTNLVESLNLECARKNVILHFLRLERNGGPYVCKNIILSKFAQRHKLWTFLDSDDYYTAEKLQSQIDVLDAEPTLIGCYTYYNRVTEDAKVVPNRGLDARRCYASLMLRREAIDRVGYFDSVRYGADEDFHNRLVHIFGTSAIHSVEQPHYRALVRDNSLTNAESKVEIAASTTTTAQSLFLSPERLSYVEVSKSRLQDPTFDANLPPFRSANHISIKGMAALPEIHIRIATFPKRFAAASQFITQLLNMYSRVITKIHVCLNEVENQQIPEEFSEIAKHPKANIYMPLKDLKDNGKFISVEKGINLWLDDDFEISPMYVEYMIAEMLRRKPDIMVSLHGWDGSAYNDRTVYHFAAQVSLERKVRVLGTGLSAMHITKDSICEVLSRIADSRKVGMVDLLVARVCAFLGIERVVLAHDNQIVKVKEIRGSSCLFEDNKESTRTRAIDQILSHIESLDGDIGRTP